MMAETELIRLVAPVTSLLPASGSVVVVLLTRTDGVPDGAASEHDGGAVENCS